MVVSTRFQWLMGVSSASEVSCPISNIGTKDNGCMQEGKRTFESEKEYNLQTSVAIVCGGKDDGGGDE